MFRYLVPSKTKLVPVVIAVLAIALVMGTGLDMAHPRVLAQASIVFDQGDEIYLFVKENASPGGTVGAPVAASGGTESLTYGLSGADADSFTINTGTGQVLVGQDTSLDYESGKTAYRMVVTATGAEGETASIDVVVTVENVDEPPEFDTLNILFEAFKVEENTAANTNIGDPIAAVDPEGEDVTYSLAGANAGLFDVDASSGQVKTKASLNYEVASEYNVAFTASDAASNSASIDLTVEVTDDPTEAPDKPAKPDVTPNPGNGHAALKVTWVAPDNAGPEITSYVIQYRVDRSSDEWAKEMVVGIGREAVLSGLESSTEYEVQVRAENDEGQGPWSESGTGETQAPPPPNSLPAFDENVVTALSVAENTAGGTAVGAAITASDPDSEDSLSYSLSGADSSLFSIGASTGQISVGAGTTLDFESPADSDEDNVYSVTLQVTDGRDREGNADTSVDDSVDVSITVTDVNEAPGFGSSTVELEIDENTLADANVGQPIQASDPESDVLNYTLSGADFALFSVDASSGQISVGASTVLDYESPSDAGGDNVYALTVSVSDGKDAAGDADTNIDAEIDVEITVNNVDEPPVFGVSAVELEVAENTATNTNIGTPITAVDPEGEGVTYSMAGASAGLFDVDASSGQVKTKSVLNYEAAGTYSVSFAASDPQSNSASIDVTIKITDDDTEAPGKPAKPTVVPNPGDGHAALKVTWAAPENAGPAITGYVVQYRVDDSADDWVQVTLAATSAETVISSLESATAYVAQVRADNDEGDGTWSDSGSGTTLAAPLENSPPEFESGVTVALSIAENSPAKTAVGMAVAASDADDQDVLTYTLSGVDSAFFTVAATGQIKVGTGTSLDFESPSDDDGDNAYELTVNVTDGRDRRGNEDTSVDDSANVTITVTNVNEPPGFGSSTQELELAENTAGDTDIGDPFSAADPESDALSYSLGGADSGLFEVDDSTGQISSGPETLFDHEAPADADGDNVYEVTVQVTDGADEEENSDTSIDDTVSVSIRVGDVNEPPEFNSESLSLVVVENSSANTKVGSPISAIDPESDTLAYSLTGVDSGHFEIGPTTGQLTVGATATFDIESPSDATADNVYELTVQVTDGRDMSGNRDNSVDAEMVVRVRVMHINEPPKFASAALELEIPENLEEGANVGDPVVADDLVSATLVYSLSGPDAELFTIEPITGQTRVETGTLLDYESPSDANADNVYEVTVQVTDGADEDGSPDMTVDATLRLTITVLNVNEAPAFETSSIELELSENTAANSSIGYPVVAIDPESDDLAYTLVGADSALFIIDAMTGQIRVGAETELDYESPADSDGDNDHELVVQVSDGRDHNGGVDGLVDAQATVTITVTDVNEPPKFEGLYVRFDVQENTPALTHVGDPVLAVDPELDSLTYSLAGDDAGIFEIDSSTGLLRVGAATALDYETPSDSNGDNIFELVAQVSDGTGGNGEVDTTIDDEIGVIISVTDVDEPGESVASTVHLAILENTPVDTEVGPPIQAVASEKVKLTYSLAGVDAASFNIDPSIGQISSKVQTDFEFPADANGDNVYEMVVQVSDGEDAEGNADRSVDHQIGVVIRVLDVNEAPEIVEAIRDRTLVESKGIDQFDVSAFFRDPDGDELTYEAASSDPRVAGAGIADATLVLAPAGIGTATIEVTAIDPGQLRNRQSFTVNVVSAQVGVGGFFPIFPQVHQGSGGETGAGTDPAKLLADRVAIVVPRAASLQPGQTVSMHVIVFNLLGDALPGSTPGLACTWSSDGGGTFNPNGAGTACTTTFTAPPAGSGTIVVRATQGRVAAVGVAVFEVTAAETTTAVLEREASPKIEFPADVTGSVIWRGDGASVTSPGGLTMEIPAGAIDTDFLGAFIRDLSTGDLVMPEDPGFAVGSYAGDFLFTDDAGHTMPGFRTRGPVRICLPFTQQDLENAVGGADGVHVVHVTPGGEYFHHPPDSNLASMMTCADVDNFSVYFVGLAVAPANPTVTPAPTAIPTPAPTATPSPTPLPTPTREPVHVPTPGPTPEATPLLPVAGDVKPGPGALSLVTFLAVVAIATGVSLLRRIRPAKRSG